jgi:hypothetical protein
MGPIGCLEKLVRSYYYSLCSNPEELSSHLLRSGSLKSRLVHLWGGFCTLHPEILKALNQESQTTFPESLPAKVMPPHKGLLPRDLWSSVCPCQSLQPRREPVGISTIPVIV